MTLLLAPYNDSMRLGMGFNSYTQTMCIDKAVEVTDEDKVKVETPSQVVTYSSKFVERLSDIVSSMNISYSAAIKKGTIEVAGNGNSIDEDKIKASDINLVVSVQVVNQTTTIKDNAQFKQMEGVLPGSPEFNDAFGDCYISGFIEGGDFNSIISMRCLDRSKTNSVIRSIKKMTNTKDEPQGFSMDSYSLSDTSSISSSSALKETETTISVNWMGGGQVKEPKTAWDIDSVHEAAAAFPSNVAKTPQKTWAILTKYKANRTFNEWAVAQNLKPLEYDAVISYTAELFNNFMEYKQLIKKIQDIIAHGDQYTVQLKPNSIPINTKTLVAVRSAIRNEMNKIVAVVNLLSRKPQILAQTNSFDVISKNALVQAIIDDAISTSPESKVIYDSTPSSTSSSSTPANKTPSSSTDAKSDTSQGVKIDLGALIAPEVWGELLPMRTGLLPIDVQDDAAARAAAGTLFTPPPKNDAVDFLTAPDNRLKIHRAICGVHDVTETLQSMVKDNTTLTIPINEIDKLVQTTVYQEIEPTWRYTKTLSFIYQYGSNGPIRTCAANFDKNSTESVIVNISSQHAVTTPRPWTKETWSIISVVCGPKVFSKDDVLKKLENQIRNNYNSNPYQSAAGLRSVSFTVDILGEDPDFGVVKNNTIFFKSSETGAIRVGVALDGSPCVLMSQPQLFTISKQKRKFELRTNASSKSVIINSGSPRKTVTFERDGFYVDPCESPFLVFDTGTSFTFQPDGNFVIRSYWGDVLWQTNKTCEWGQAMIMQFQPDGNFGTYKKVGINLWPSNTNGTATQMVLADSKPYFQFLGANGANVWNSGN